MVHPSEKGLERKGLTALNHFQIVYFPIGT